MYESVFFDIKNNSFQTIQSTIVVLHESRWDRNFTEFAKILVMRRPKFTTNTNNWIVLYMNTYCSV
jgi:hypothetical protein